MISVIRNPLGHKLSDNLLEGEVTDSAGDVLITTSISHGLSDGDYIYVDSNIGTYNGFRYVDSVSYNTFKLKESENGDYIPYKQDADVTYQVSVLNHGVQCVHLPIVYELESSIFPNNTEEEEYTPNAIDSFEDVNGNVQINLSQPLTDPTRYSKIQLVGDGPLAGVYQIIQVLQPWSVVINLAYDASLSFVGYTVVRYYDNYAMNVNIYSGLYPGHRWQDEKPIALLATLRLIPDDDNRTLFSISEYLRSHIKTLNDLTIDTFPNNIHFLTEFYIGYFESYDVSDGDEITTFADSESTDSFLGQAINAKNEFKNLYSGHLSDYVSEADHPAQWLTDFETPIAIVGYYFDISFILIFNDVDVVITIYKQAGDVVTGTDTITIENPGKGVIRVELTPEAGYDQYCIQAATAGAPGSTNPITLPVLADWNTLTSDPDLYDWTEGAAPTVNLPDPVLPDFFSVSEYIWADYSFIEGTEYSITINYTAAFGGPTPATRQPKIAIMDSSFNVIVSSSFGTTYTNAGANTATFNFTATAATTKVAFNHRVSRDADITITSRSANEIIPDVPAQTLTEQLCITILEACDSTLIGDLRGLESGDYRLLE